MDNTQYISALQQANLFRGLSAAELTPLAKACQVLSLAARQRVFAAEAPARHFFIVINGSVRLYRLNPNGKEKVIELILAGQSFAEAMVLLQKPYPVFAETLEVSTLLAIPSAVFLTQLRQQPELSFKVMASLSMRLHQFVNDIHALSLESAQQRVAGFLLALTADELSHLSISKAVIASRLGLTPETFSRVLSKLKEQGSIAETEGELQVLNRASLLQVRQWTTR